MDSSAPGWGRCLAFIGAVLLGIGGAAAQSTLPQPVLITIHPCAGQAGGTVEVAITGTEVVSASNLHFSTPGIACQPGAKPGQFALTIGKDVPCGYHDVRAVTRYGISNPRVFAVTRLPVVELKPDTKAEAGHVFVGRAAKQEHCLLPLEAQKGSPLQILCEAAALDSRMAPVLSVHDASGAEVARMQGGAPLLFTPQTDGPFTLDVHDLMFRGDAEHPFLLALSKPGATGLESPLPLHPSESLDADATQPVVIEDVCTGWFAARSKPRLFTFTAKKDEVRIIEVKCARLGLDGDPSFIIEKMDGDKATFVAEANDRPAIAGKEEFDGGWADPVLRLQVKEDGVYRVKLRNLYPTRVPFELSVRPPGTAFKLVAFPFDALSPKKTVTAVLSAPLWRGGVSALRIVALRERGFTGPITLTAEGLPPGVTSPGGLIAEGKDVGYICFAAEPGAEPWGGAVRIIGAHGDFTTTARGGTIVRPTPNTQREGIYTRITQEVALGVASADCPLLVEAPATPQEVASDGKLSVPLKLTRRGAFADAVKLTALGIGAPATPPSATIAAKATEGKLELDIAKLKLPPGDHPVLLQGTAKFQHQPGDDPKAKPKELTAIIYSMPFTIRVK